MKTLSKNTIISIVAVILLIALGWYVMHRSKAPAGAAGSTDTVATVNGENITRAELVSTEAQINAQLGGAATTTALMAQVQTQAVDSLVAQTLLKQATLNAGITASSTQIQAQLQSIKSQFPTPDAYTKALSIQGVTEAELVKQITSTLAIQEYLNRTSNLSAVTATDAEIKAAYDQVATGKANVPPLTQVKDQVKQLVIQQKQKVLIDAEVAKLRAQAKVNILI
jgi:hypothetical protein